MEHTVSGLTHFINLYLGHAANWVLFTMGLHAENPREPIPEHVAMGVVVLIIATVLALIVRMQLSVERPGALQQLAEGLLTNSMEFGILDLLKENVGHEGVRHVAFVGSISLFILLGNLFGAFPFLTAPTGAVTVPLACAALTFLYFNVEGVRHHGLLGYMKTFAGSPHDVAGWVLAILLFPVEIISTSARILSLTVRLWANMFASDLIYVIFLGLLSGGATYGYSKSPVLGVILGVFPALIPILFIGLHIFVSVVQAYVFTVLPAVYLGLATSEEH